ncbi:MAG: anti-sigma factor domain-containing protein [Anaerolineae bacterium]
MAKGGRFVVDHDEMRALLPLYALGALEAEESEAVASHLPRCDSCPAELAEWRRVVGDLAFAPERDSPPEHLKANLLAAVSLREQPTQLPEASSFGRLRRIAAPLAAGLALVAVGLSAYLAGQIQELAASQAALEERVSGQREAIQFLTSDAVVTVSLEPEPAWSQAAGRVYLAPGELMGMLVVQRMPVLPAGQSYQLWLVADGDRDSGGLFVVDESGGGYLVIHAPRPLSQYVWAGITQEPEEGSPAPTGDRLMGGRL